MDAASQARGIDGRDPFETELRSDPNYLFVPVASDERNAGPKQSNVLQIGIRSDMKCKLL